MGKHFSTDERKTAKARVPSGGNLQLDTLAKLAKNLRDRSNLPSAVILLNSSEFQCDLVWQGEAGQGWAQKALQIRKEVERKFPNVRGGVGIENDSYTLRFRVYPEVLQPRPPSSKDRYRSLAEILPAIRKIIPRKSQLELRSSRENALAEGFALEAPNGNRIRMWLDPQMLQQSSQSWRIVVRVGDCGMACASPNQLDQLEVLTAVQKICDLSQGFKLARVSFVGGDAHGDVIPPLGWSHDSWERGQRMNAFLPETAVDSILGRFLKTEDPTSVVMVCPWCSSERMVLTSELDARLAALTQFHSGPLPLQSLRDQHASWKELLRAGDAMRMEAQERTGVAA